jgi:hypothetical protein
MQSDRFVQLQKLVGALVGRIEFPPKLESEQALVEAARPRGIRDTQPYVVENDSVTDHYSLLQPVERPPAPACITGGEPSRIETTKLAKIAQTDSADSRWRVVDG